MHLSEEQVNFVVEEPDPAIYNPTGADPPIWQPRAEDILSMFQQLEKDSVLPLKWVCPGRRPPEKETNIGSVVVFSKDDEYDDENKADEKKIPEPSEFDFDELASEVSPKLTPRTPVSAKACRPEKRVARMDNVLSTLRRQQKAEREARKNQGRSPGISQFISGTSPHMGGYSSGGSPLPTRPSTSTTSPHPHGSPSSSRPGGSPGVSRPPGSPASSRPPPSTCSTSAGASTIPRPISSPSSTRRPSSYHSSPSPKGVGSPAASVASMIHAAASATTSIQFAIGQYSSSPSISSTARMDSVVLPQMMGLVRDHPACAMMDMKIDPIVTETESNN